MNDSFQGGSMNRPWHSGEAPRRQTRADVLDEICRRAAQGRDLNSGANRGDWLYAAAVRFFGNWRAAIEEAGFAYEAVKLRNLTAEEVLHEISALAAAGGKLHAGQHPRLSYGALGHFGSWASAVEAAGCALPLKWAASD